MIIIPPDEVELGSVYICSDNMDKPIKLNAEAKTLEPKQNTITEQEEYIDLKQYQDLDSIIDLCNDKVNKNNTIINDKLLNLMLQEYKMRKAKEKLCKTNNKQNIKHKKKNKTYKNWERKEFWRK